MNKKIAEFAAAHGLVYDKEGMRGVFNGYQVSTNNFTRALSAACVVGFHVNLGAKSGEALTYLTVTNKKALQISRVMTDGSGIYVVLVPFTLGGTLKKIDALLNAFTQYLASLGIDGSACPYCGQPMEGGGVLVSDGGAFHAHEKCFNEKLAAVTEAENVENSMPNNYLQGTAGAVLGALAGCAVFAILFAVGYLASVSSLVGAILASLLYTKFGGKNNKIKILIVAVVTLVLILLTFLICNVVSLHIALREEGIGGSAWYWLFYTVSADEEVARLFWRDFALTVFFALLGLAFSVVTMIREQKKVSKGMKKMP